MTIPSVCQFFSFQSFFFLSFFFLSFFFLSFFFLSLSYLSFSRSSFFLSSFSLSSSSRYSSKMCLWHQFFGQSHDMEPNFWLFKNCSQNWFSWCVFILFICLIWQVLQVLQVFFECFTGCSSRPTLTCHSTYQLATTWGVFHRIILVAKFFCHIFFLHSFFSHWYLQSSRYELVEIISFK